MTTQILSRAARPMSHGAFRLGWVLAFVALSVLVVLLARQNQRLEVALQAASQRSVGGLAEGDTMPRLELAELDGRSMSLSFEGAARASLLLVFDTTCAACDQNMDRWLELYQRYGESYRFVAIGLDEPQATLDYARRHELPFQVVVPRDPYFAGSVGIVGVPETLLVGTDGRVEALHLGVLPEDWRVGSLD